MPPTSLPAPRRSPSASLTVHVAAAAVLLGLVIGVATVACRAAKDPHAGAEPADLGLRMPVLAISLKRHAHRRARLASRAPEVAFVDAVDGLLLRRRPRGITRGELACFYSHVGVWLHIVAAGDPVTLVLEDDADIRLPELWEDIREALSCAPPDLDVLFLGHNNQHGRPGVRPARADVWGCHAMLISRAGARKLCDAYADNEGTDPATGNHLPVDVWMSRQRGLRLYCVLPSMVHPVDIDDSETQRVR